MKKEQNGRLMVVLAVALVVTLMPVAVSAVGGTFTDDDTSIFEPDIEWLASAGVTLGCNPPTNDRFCPDDNVSRGQMSAFMRRFAQYLGAEDGQVSRADHADSATDADSSADADMLDGKDPSAFDTFIVADAEADDNFSPYVTIAGATIKLAEVSFIAPAAGAMAVTGTASFQHDNNVLGYVDLTIFAQLDNTTCSFSSKLPTAYGIASAAPAVTEPLWNSVAFTSSTAVTAGAHTLTLCGFDSGGDDVGVLAAGITGTISPSSNNNIGATVTNTLQEVGGAGSR